MLVIDDDPAARDLMKRFLTREGFQAGVRRSGEEGLRLAREIHPNVITLDVMMPKMDGWAVLQQLKADPQLRDTPVIMVTIVDDQEPRVHARARRTTSRSRWIASTSGASWLSTAARTRRVPCC